MNNVLHVITTIEKGGAENQLLILAEAQVQAGMEVTILPLKGKDELRLKFEEIGAKVDLSLINKLFLKQIFIFSKKYKKYDGIIHAHLPKAEILVAITTVNQNTVFTRHNSEQFFPKAPARFSCLLSKVISRKLKFGIAISNAVLDFCLQNHEISSKTKMSVVYYGFTFDRYRNIDHRVKYDFGTVARLVPQKDIKTLLKAFSLLKEKGNNLKLVIIGDGEEKKALYDFAEKLHLNDSIYWAGRQENIINKISEMKVFILTSIYEGLGLVLLEAIASNTPILAANNTAIPEVLGDNFAGLFKTGDEVELSNLMERSLNSTFAIQLVTEYDSRVELFKVERMQEEISNIYLLTNSRKKTS